MKNRQEQMAELLGGLTAEQREKAKDCKTAGELIALLSEEGAALPDELLDTVAGGGKQEDLEFLLQLSHWDDVCMQRGIGPDDLRSREAVWKELYPCG